VRGQEDVGVSVLAKVWVLDTDRVRRRLGLSRCLRLRAVGVKSAALRSYRVGDLSLFAVMT
jgi:hypothetical protein